ncbi:hypothetical protein ACFL4W_04530, partial [Planctomycetota bacterium]
MKKTLTLILVLLSSLALTQSLEDIPLETETPVSVPAASGEEAKSQPASGSVMAIEGKVISYSEKKPEEKLALQKYSAVATMNMIETDATGWLVISLLGDKGYVYIAPNSKVQIDYQTYKSSSHFARVLLWKGIVRAYSPKLYAEEWSCFAVVTPNASVGSPGGDYSVKYAGDEDGKAGGTVAKCFMGSCPVVQVTSAARNVGSRTIEAEQVMGVSSKQGLSKTATFNITDKERDFWTD